MQTSKLFAITLAALALGACGPSSTEHEAGTGSDVVTHGDTMTPTDTVTPTDDTVTPTDDVMTTMTDGGGGDFGMCGASTHTCLCACAMGDQACQQGCLTMNRTCATCVQGAQAMCCPTQDSALQACAMAAQMDSDAGPACTDQACLEMRCMSQINDYNTCLMAMAMDATCQMHLSACFGADGLTCM